MDFPNNNFDELLSGMLDGMLSDQELRVLEQAMADDPSLQAKLDDLAASRSALLRGRSRGRLGPDFAKSVSLAARDRAAALGPDAPAWLVPTDFHRPGAPVKPAPQESISPLETIPAFKRAWVYACVSLAAVFALIFVFIQEPEKQGLVQLDPQATNTSESSDLKVIEKAEELLAASPNAAEKSSENTLFKEEAPSQNAALLDTESAIASLNTENQAGTTTGTMATGESTIAAPTEPSTASVAVVDSAGGVKEADRGNSVASTEPKKSKTKKSKNEKFLTAAIYITIDEVALQNRALESILEDHGVAYSSDHVLSDEELKRLSQSGLATPAQDEQEGNVQVLFLKSTVENIGLAMESMLAQEKDFPQCLLEMTEDASAGKLVKQLSSIEVAEGSKGFARRIVPAGTNGSGLPFVVSNWRSGSTPVPKNSGNALSPEMIAMRQQAGYALLFVRPAK
jgi:hypothetical protein